MSTQRYTVTPYQIETLLTWVKSGEIAIPGIQRPFSFGKRQMYAICLAHSIKDIQWAILLHGAAPRWSLRMAHHPLVSEHWSAYSAALLGQQVVTKDYEQVRIRIVFNPLEEKFEVSNPTTTKNTEWVTDVVEVFAPGARLFDLVNSYYARNYGIGQGTVFQIIEKLRKITNNLVGVIGLDCDLDVEIVTEIFIRVNSAGAELKSGRFCYVEDCK